VALQYIGMRLFLAWGHGGMRLFLVSLQALQIRAQPAPAGAACITADGALFKCTGGANGAAKYDLTDFQTPPQLPVAGYYSLVDEDTHDYYIEGTGGLTTVTCGDPTVATPVAIQSWGGGEPPTIDNSCGAIGDYSTQACVEIAAAPAAPGAAGPPGPTGGLKCSYTGGSDGRTVDVSYMCDKVKYGVPAAAQVEGQDTAYTITFAGPAACPILSGGGMSGGTLFLILFPVAIVLYLGIGMGYNYKVREIRGIEMIPQLEYWKQVPGLVKDGCIFFWQQSVAAYEHFVKGRGTPSDRTLKQGLKSAEADDAT